MIVGNKEKRIKIKKRKQIQERRIKNLLLITSVIELALTEGNRIRKRKLKKDGDQNFTLKTKVNDELIK